MDGDTLRDELAEYNRITSIENVEDKRAAFEEYYKRISPQQGGAKKGTRKLRRSK
jgi:hypothetical protein